MYTVTHCFCVVVKWSKVKISMFGVSLRWRLNKRIRWRMRLLRYTDSLIDWPPQRTDAIIRRIATYVHDERSFEIASEGQVTTVQDTHERVVGQALELESLRE